MNLESAEKEFLNYTEKYRELGSSCLLKIHHTFRVEELCERIARSLSLSEEDVKLAKLSGLLHDIGRFEQWKNYQTFNDVDSIDHAELALSILSKDNYLEKYLTDSSLKETLFNSIYYHNKFELSETLSDRDRLFCNIIRDADKIDILYLYTIGEIKVDTQNEALSPKIYDDLLNGKQIKRSDKKTKADILSVSLGFIFDINYTESFQILEEKDYLNKEIDIYKSETENEELKEQLENIREKIKTYSRR